MAFILSEKKPTAFLTAIDILFWLINERRVLAIPMPAISIALIDTNDKNCEKLLIILLSPLAEFSGYLKITFFQWIMNFD